jgi:hypothetical protein
MKKTNSRKESFLASFSDYQIKDIEEKLQENICFNFQFFDNSQKVGQDFKHWDHAQLYSLLDKLKEYSKKTPLQLQNMKIGGGKKGKNNSILEIYVNFPVNSDFVHPKYIPSDVEWARFRLDNRMRLIGFLVRNEVCQKLAVRKTIFYVVFLDRDHRFYKT